MGFALLASAVGKGGTCTSTDTPLQWTIETNYVDGTLNSVLSDNGTPYVDGQSGVTARINICSGTNDATLNLKTRYYTVNFLKHFTRIERDVVARGVSLPWPICAANG